jgi:glycosyltransferase involved in cell wall biosynthesis
MPTPADPPPAGEAGLAEPLVSVIIAVRNGEQFLGAAIESALAQSWPRCEVIVVDGGSSDRSRDIARSCAQVRLIEQRSTGFAGAWNEGILAAHGPLIAILDSDDLWDPRKIELQVRALAAHPQCGYAISRTRFLRMPGAPLPPGFDRVDLQADHSAPYPSAMLARREMFDHVGLFDESLRIASDIEWFRKARDMGVEPLNMPEVLLHRRIHEGNLSSRPPEPALLKRELLSLLRDSLNRRRAAP